MPRPRFDKLPPDKQDAILQAATEAFAEHGFAGAAYNAIIAQAGVSKGAMYYYFDDKEDLFVTVVERALAPIFDGLFDRPPATSAEAFWADLVARLAAFAHVFDDPHVIGLLRDLFGSRAAVGTGEATRRLRARMNTGFERMLADGQRVGAVRDDLPLSLLTTIAIEMGLAADRWLLERLDTLRPAERDRVMAGTMQMFQRLLAP